MRGNNRQQKKSSSLFSFFNIFKAKRSREVVEDNLRDDPVRYHKLWPSDEDRGQYVAEPGIDRKATIYIDKIRTQYVAEHDRQASN